MSTVPESPTRLPAAGDIVFFVHPIDGRPVVVALRVMHVFLEPSPGRFGGVPAHWRVFGVPATGGAIEVALADVHFTRETAHEVRKRWRPRGSR